MHAQNFIQIVTAVSKMTEIYIFRHYESIMNFCQIKCLIDNLPNNAYMKDSLEIDDMSEEFVNTF